MRIWKPEVGEWREVSVNGSIHEPRTQPSRQGGLLAAEDSRLTNGTIIDLAGIQLLFESAPSMAQSARLQPADIMENFNARKPQCPVQMHTIRFEYDEAKRAALENYRKPYIFPACGHVHAYAPELEHVRRVVGHVLDRDLLHHAARAVGRRRAHRHGDGVRRELRAQRPARRGRREVDLVLLDA